jgi:hypothetical protein
MDPDLDHACSSVSEAVHWEYALYLPLDPPRILDQVDYLGIYHSLSFPRLLSFTCRFMPIGKRW